MGDFNFMEERSSQDNKQKYILIALISMVVLLAGAMVYFMMDNSKIKAAKAKIERSLNEDKEYLTRQALELRARGDSLSARGDSLSIDNEDKKRQVDTLNIEIQLLIEKISKTEATNRSKIRQYEQELGTLRTIMRDYVHQIDSLNRLNKKLTDDAAAARKEAAASKKKTEELTKTVANLSNQVSAGAVLKAYGLTTKAYNSSDKVSDRSSRVTYLITSLTLGANDLAARGPVLVYVRVKDPEGFLLVGETQRTFEYNGEVMSSTDSREVDYQGDAVEVNIYLNGVPEYSKGLYTIEAYTDQSLLGTTELMLR